MRGDVEISNKGVRKACGGGGIGRMVRMTACPPALTTSGVSSTFQQKYVLPVASTGYARKPPWPAHAGAITGGALRRPWPKT